MSPYYQFHALKTCLALHTSFFFLIGWQKIAKFGKQWWHLPPTPASPTSCLPPIQPTNFQHFQICRLRNHADDLANSDHRFDQSPGAKTGFGSSAGRASSDFTETRNNHTCNGSLVHHNRIHQASGNVGASRCSFMPFESVLRTTVFHLQMSKLPRRPTHASQIVPSFVNGSYMKDSLGYILISKGRLDRDALRWRNASKPHQLQHESPPLDSDLSRRLMGAAVVAVCIKSVHNNAHGYCEPCRHRWHDPDMHAAPIKICLQLQTSRQKLKRQTGSTNASSNTSYRQKTSKHSAEDRVGRRGSLSSPQSTEHSGSPVLNERDRSACQLDARKAAHYFLLHHQTVAYSWRPSAGSSAAKTPTFLHRLVFILCVRSVLAQLPPVWEKPGSCCSTGSRLE